MNIKMLLEKMTGKKGNRIKLLSPEKRGRVLGALYSWPMGAWFTIFFTLPLLIIIAYSFMQKGLHGGVVNQFSLDAYRQIANSKYGIILLRTLEIAFISTFISVLIALPCGYAMARSSAQTMLLIFVMIPFWTNSLIRIFGWMAILGNDGYVNAFLQKIGLITDYAKLLYNKNAIILVSVYMYLPYAILPIFTAIDRFDFSLLEAARDLGANKPQAIWKTLIPNIKSGLITAIIFTFIPIFGAYTVPLLVGGMGYMIGNIIVDQVQITRNWPLAAAFSMIITLVSTLGVLWMLGAGKEDAAKKASASDTEAKRGTRKEAVYGV